MDDKFLVSVCKNCNNSQLEVHIGLNSICAFCRMCQEKVFDISDFKKFFKEMKKIKCEDCNRELFEKKLVN